MSCSILMGIQWPLQKRVQIQGLLWILLGNVDFVLLMKAQITQKKINWIYFNIVDLCGILPYKRMYSYKCGIKINFDILTTQKDQ